MKQALLFINGVPPNQLPETDGYQMVACSDGAFRYLKEKGYPLDQLDFISGDFDSHNGSDEDIYSQRFIYTPDQDKTDFQKSLEILLERGIQKVDVYGGSGGEMDHFLGNLHVAYLFKSKLKITFYDEFACYFFAEEHTVLNDVKNRMVSLYPYPEAAQITTKGLKWPLSGETLNMTDRIGTRNLALEDSVVINFERGALVLFVGLATGDANGSAEG
ncbi:thiamine diphosphokinase [Marnyiella aurantia]|uniref:Thiamine diphosphokinase n=1 Tax=Marnyiella aurantia TaxID=2758037 RepID=A0A7D7LRQ7_9FLAO|nr:thiamine diphosphokinase [Marnyiella aurantia]MBA5246311.1 thiamine diphosphokinase [Marnyiella aurantia]QMS98318.1 thiamine diphosphokinase [Marnyiella aurantia]